MIAQPSSAAQAKPFQVLHDKQGDHPPGGHDVRPFPTVTTNARDLLHERGIEKRAERAAFRVATALASRRDIREDQWRPALRCKIQ